jgi:hypothetical protein
MWQSNPLPFLQVAYRWLLPWATILATSALIAHVAGAMLAPALALETFTPVTSNEQSLPAHVDKTSTLVTVPSTEGNGSLTRVRCPSDPDVITDVQVVSLQDLDLLINSLCVVQPQATG